MARLTDIRLRRSAVSGNQPGVNDLNLGELALNTADGKLYMKKSVGGTDSIVEIGADTGSIASTFTAFEYTATSSQTTFSGSDNYSNTLAYNTGTPPKVQVFMNGILLDEGSSADYTATNGTSVVLTTGASTGDLVQIHAYKSDVSVNNDLSFGDNVKLEFGDAQDLQIYHDGSDSYVADRGTGNLRLEGTNIALNNQGSNKTYLLATDGGSVQLRHNDVTKLETDAAGVNITGGLDVGNITSTGTINMNHDGATLFLGADIDMRIKHDGSNGTIQNDTGDLLVDVAGTIKLDSDNGTFYFQDNGTIFGIIEQAGTSMRMRSGAQDGDIIFMGNDGGSNITALTLDMSDGGAAHFGNDVRIADSQAVRFGNDQDFRIYSDGSSTYLANSVLNQDIYVQGRDSSALYNMLTMDMSARKSTFAGIVSNPTGFEVGNMFIMPNEIDVSSGNLHIDVASSIILDSDAGNVYLRDSGTDVGLLSMANTDLYIRSLVSDRDIIFQGYDGSSNITALTLDMSDAGAALFNSRISATNADFRNNSSGAETTALSLRNYAAGANTATALTFYPTQSTTRFASIVAENVDGNNNIALSFLTSAGDTPTAALTLNQDRSATFSAAVTAGGLKIDGGTLSHASSNASSITISGGSNSTNGMNMSLGGSSGSLSQSVVWKQNSSEKMRLDSSGRLGIGESSPTSPLHVTHTGGTGVRLKTDGDNDSNLIHFKTSSNTGQGYVGTEGGTSGGNFIGSLAYSFLVGGTSSGSKLQFLSAGQVRGTFDTGGNLGIGTNAPASLLNLSHATAPELRFSRTGTGQQWVQSIDSSGRLLFLEAASTGGTLYTRMSIDDTGEVGMGTAGSSSGIQLQIGNTANSSAITRVTNGTTFVDLTASSSGKAFLEVGSNHPLILATNATERMRISNTGQVGINRTSFLNTNVKLEVGGADNVPLIAAEASGVRAGLGVQSSGLGLYVGTTNVIKATSGGAVTFNSAFTFPTADGSSGQVLQTDGSGNVAWATVSGGGSTVWSTSGSNIYYNSGNVGIGNSSPTSYSGYKILHLGSAASGGQGLLKFGTGATADGPELYAPSSGNRLHINTSGAANVLNLVNSNVGIGTTAPSFPLTVYGANQNNGSANRMASFFDTTSATTGTGAGIALGGYTNGTGSAINDFGVIQGIKENGTAGNYASALTFHTRANGAGTLEQMRISSTGNVGIGTTAPSSFLTVDSGTVDDVYTPTAFNDKAQIKIDVASTQNNYAGIQFTHSGNTEGFIGLVRTSTNINDADFVIQGYSSATSAYAEKMRITDDGKVGIGTTNPQGNLSIKSGTNVDLELFSEATGVSLQSYNRSSSSYGYIRFMTDSSGETARFDTSGNLIVGKTATTFATQGAVINHNGTIDATRSGDAPLYLNRLASDGNIIALYKDSVSIGSIGTYSGDMTIGTTDVALRFDDNVSALIPWNISNNTSNNAAISLGYSTVKFTDLHLSGSASIGSASIDNYAVNTSSTSAAQVDTFSATAIRSARFTVQITNTTDSTYQVTEILLIHDGTTPAITEYGTIFTGSAKEASFDADIVSGNVRLLATPASSDSMQFKTVRHSILV